jgi:hypothetical protein
MSNINSKFYIIKGQNKLLNSDFATNYPKTCDGLRVHWQPDVGDLFETFSKNTEYVITFNDTINIDFIRFYLIPTSNYSKFGTTMQYDNNNNTYWMPYLRLYYSTNGTSWNSIDNSNAISISEWFSQYQTQYQPYIGEINNWGWINNNEGFFAIKLNSTIQAKYLKFSLNRTTTFLNDYKVCEIEAFELIKFSIKEFRYNTERSIIENGVNDFTIDCTADDLDFNIYNNISTRNEIFGKVNIDGTDYLYGNLIVDLTEIDTVSRELTMTLLPYTMINYNRIIDYNTPVIAKRSDYYPYDIIDLLMLMANRPSYFLANFYAFLSPVIFIPQHNENIITNLTNFLEANRQVVVYRDYKDNWGFASRGYDTQSTYTKTNPQYIELPQGNGSSEYVYFTNFSNDFLDRNFWKNFFNQIIYRDYSTVGVYRTEAKQMVRKKRSDIFIYKKTKKVIETVYENIPVEKTGELIASEELNLLNYSPVKASGSPYNSNSWMIETNYIVANAMTYRHSSDRMRATIILQMDGYNQDLKTRIDKMKFTYKDVRGEISFDFNFGKEFFRWIPFVYPSGSYDYPDLNYNGKTIKLTIALDVFYNDTKIRPVISLQTFNSSGQNIDFLEKDCNPSKSGNERFANMFSTKITDYNAGFLKVEIWAKSGLPTPYIPNFRFSKVYLSGFARQYLISSFPAYSALNIDIKEWQGFILTNKQINNNAEGIVMYKADKGYELLSKDEYTLNKIDYPVKTSNVYFAYILKNVYPYTTGGKLWEIASINETIQFNTSTPSSYIEKYCKNLNYSKTTNQYDREYIISLLRIYQKDINNVNKKYSKDINLYDTNDYTIETIEANLLDTEKIIAYFSVGDKLYMLIIDNQMHTINDGVNYFEYKVTFDNYKITYYIKNLKSSSPTDLIGKLNIDYVETVLDDIEIINNYNILQKQYGVIEYEVNSMQTFTASQIYFIKTFFDWYNQSPVFTMKDIVIDGDMGLNLNNSFIKVIDKYLGKKIWIYPNRIEHYITEDLLFETSIQGKIIGEEAV